MRKNKYLFTLFCLFLFGIIIVLFGRTVIQNSNVDNLSNVKDYDCNTNGNALKTVVEISGKTTEEKSFLNILNFNKTKNDFQTGLLEINGKTIKIYLYGKQDYISREILMYKIWEKDWLEQLLLFMQAHNESQLLDLGCNLGIYTLSAAAFGYKVVAVDANKNNTDRLVQSAIVNNLTDRIKIISNAVSNVQRQFSMSIDVTNVGGQEIIENGTSTYKVYSIFLDELIPSFEETSKIIIKMDIQGSEVNAIKKASKFFLKRKVIAVLIEWFMLKNSKECYILVFFFRSRGYRPYAKFFSNQELDTLNYKSWPHDVVWRLI